MNIEEPQNTEAKDGKLKGKIIWVIGALVIIGAVSFYVWKIQTEQQGTPNPVFQRDEPVQEQILQDDFREKVEEMLDSGLSVAEISKETGLRKDVIRKIKREMSN